MIVLEKVADALFKRLFLFGISLRIVSLFFCVLNKRFRI